MLREMLADLRQNPWLILAFGLGLPLAGYCPHTLYSDMHQAKWEMENCRSVPGADCSRQTLAWQRATWDYTMVDGRGLGKKDFPAQRP
jgi:hypothetical protein